MMDLDGDTLESEASSSMTAHRVRFVDWAPSAITSIVFLPLEESSSQARSIMAVGYENGNINLCLWAQDDTLPSSSSHANTEQLKNPVLPKGWIVDTTLVGAIPSKVDTLAFLYSADESGQRKPRLFSTSGGSIITEHSLPPHIIQTIADVRRRSHLMNSKSNSVIKGASRSISSQGGAVWCMAASPLGRYLAIGCEDGHVRIIDIADDRFELLATSRSARRAGDGTIEGIVNILDRTKTRIVSLTWGAPMKKSLRVSRKVAAQSSRSESSSSQSSEDENEDEWEERFLLGGTTHSSALLWSLRTGRIEAEMLVEKSRNEQTIVWSVATLANGTLVLGDSLGHVSFFDGKTQTLLPGGRFNRHSRGADVLSLCVGPDGKTVYSSGLDQKVNEYTLVGDAEGTKQKWICTGSRRLHAHDVRALAIDPPYMIHRSGFTISTSDRVPILVSGGNDFNLVYTPATSPSHVMPVNGKIINKKQRNIKAHRSDGRFDEINPVSTSPFTTFADTIQRRIPFVSSSARNGALGGGGVIRICAAKRWIMLRRETSLAIWHIPEATGLAGVDSIATSADDSSSPWTKMLEMQLKVKSNIVCAELSNDGKYLAVSDLYETKLFSLFQSGSEIVPKKIKSFSKTLTQRGLQYCPGSSAMSFTPESSRIILASYPGSFIHIIELPTGDQEGEFRLLKTFDQHRKRVIGRATAGRQATNGNSNGHVSNGINGGPHSDEDSESSPTVNGASKDNDEDERSTFARIDLLQVSPDGQYLVSIDTSGRIHTFSLDTLHHHCSLPSTPLTPSSIVFDSFRPGRMCLILPTNQILIHNLEDRGNSSATEGDIQLAEAMTKKLVTIRESAIGAIWLSPSHLLVWGSTWICTAKSYSSTADFSKLSKRDRLADAIKAPSEIEKQPRYHTNLTFKYQPLLHVGLFKSLHGNATPQVVIVERPYYDIAPTLPPTWFSGSKYGT